MLLLLLPLLSNRNVSVSFTFSSKMHSSDGIWAIIPNSQRWLSAIFFQRFGRKKKTRWDRLSECAGPGCLCLEYLCLLLSAGMEEIFLGRGKLYGHLLVKRLCSFKFYCGRHLRLFLLAPSASYSSLWRYHFLLFSVFGGGHFGQLANKNPHTSRREREATAG